MKSLFNPSLPSALLCCLLCMAAPALLRAQTVIGAATPGPSAMLDVQSADKGLLPPRLSTAQRNAIPSPATGLIVYNTDQQCLELNIGTPLAADWLCLERPKEPSSNGTAIVSTYGGPGCAGPAAVYGTLQNAQVANGAYLLLYANVTQTGAWNLSAAANGITFSGKGAFTATGCQPVVLTASGIPAAAGAFTWTTNSVPAGNASATVAN